MEVTAEIQNPLEDLPLEQALLGSLLTNNARIDTILDHITPGHFSSQAHSRLFGAMLTLWKTGSGFSPETLRPFFKNDPSLEDVGGDTYLVRMMHSSPVVPVSDLAKGIVDLAKRRALVTICNDLMTATRTLKVGTEVDNLLDNAEQAIFKARTSDTISKGWQHISVATKEATEEIEQAIKSEGVAGLPTGLKALDDKIGGLKGGRTYILAGRPGMFKSALAGHLARVGASSGTGVGIFSREMPKREYAERLISDITRRLETPMPYEDLDNGKITDREVYDEAKRLLNKLPLVIDDGRQNLASLCLNARRLQRSQAREGTKLGLIVIDYLQLIMGAPGDRRRRNEIVGEMSREMKELAKELNIPVVVVCQLNRECEKRDNKRPLMSDLGEAGQIEQDADVIIFPYCDRTEPSYKKDKEAWAVWHEEQRSTERRLELIIGKQRGGSTGSVFIKNFIDTATLRDL